MKEKRKVGTNYACCLFITRLYYNKWLFAFSDSQMAGGVQRPVPENMGAGWN